MLGCSVDPAELRPGSWLPFHLGLAQCGSRLHPDVRSSAPAETGGATVSAGGGTNTDAAEVGGGYLCLKAKLGYKTRYSVMGLQMSRQSPFLVFCSIK